MFQSLLEGKISMQNENKLCCEEHTDIAFDDFLIENETFPNVERVDEGKCDYCDNKANYILKISIEG